MYRVLSDTHRVIMANAAARENLQVLPLPSTINSDPDALTKTLAELIEDGLLVEYASEDSSSVWRSEDDANARLLITEQGMRAIGILPPSEDGISSAPDAVKIGNPPAAGSKLQELVALLSRPQGAVIEDLMSATGWQKHSVRGAISGALKRKHHHLISSVVIEGRGRVYRIGSADETPSADPSCEFSNGAGVGVKS